MYPSILLGLSAVSLALAAPQFPVPAGDGTLGSGPFPSNYSTDPALPDHTIYAPINPGKNKFPVILWGNGMCMDQGLGFRNFVNEIASHGYYVIANGKPRGTGQSTNKEMEDALNWAAKSPHPMMDGSNIAAAGQSCGGFEVYDVSPDPRIKVSAMFDSGNIMGNFDVSKLHAPIGYFLGGTSDIAYSAGSNDFKKLPKSVPAILINNPKGGHMQTYMNKQGGLSGKAAVAFFDWLLKKDAKGYEMFTSKTSVIGKAGWEVTMKNFPSKLTSGLSASSGSS